MLITQTKRKEYKIWSALAAFLFLLFLSGWFLFKAHLQHEIEAVSKESKDSFKLISMLVKEKLQKRYYKEAQNFIVNWGEKSPEIVEVILSTKSGFKLVHYVDADKVLKIKSHKIIETADIFYSYAGIANLTIHRSIDTIYQNHRILIYQYLTGFALVAIVLYLLVYINLRTHKQKQQLVEENNQRKKALIALHKSESKYRQLIDNLKKHYFFYSHDTDGIFTYLSQSITEILGYTQKEFLNHYETYLTNEPMNKQVYLYTTKTIEGKQQLPYTLSIYHKNGSVRYLEVTENPVFGDNNQVIGVEGIARDITDIYHVEQERKEQQQLLQSVIDGISDTLMVINENYTVSLMNSAAQALINKDIIKDINSPKCYEISHHRSSPCSGTDHPCPLNLVLENKGFTSVIHKHITGVDNVRQVELNASPLKDKNGKVYAIIESAHDITKLLQTQKNLNERSLALEHLAHHDELTSLPNRLLLSDRLTQSIKLAHRHKKKFAVLFIDLDNFKKINDSLGHGVGDIILQETAKRLKHCVRETDTVARLGGDEFTVIVNDVQDNDVVTEITTKIIHDMQTKFQIDEHKLYITTSIGVSIYPDDAISAENLLRNADAAMYKAKDGGRNTYRYYTEDMTQKAFEHILMESNLRHALKYDELIVYYQPQVNANNNQIVGMEALVRWIHPELGMISPAQFIPLAEKTGLIVQLGEHVFDIATKQMAIWVKEYQFTGRVAINLSVKQLRQKNLFEVLSDTLERNHCKPDWVELEITENYVMNNPEQAIRTLQKLQDMGIEIAIDDFGTGYSSLSYLKRLPVNKLKIDQSFVRDIVEDEDDRIIITSTIALAKNMKLGIIAEGVETLEQKNYILEQGCGLIQGYYYSRPVPELEMTQLLNSTDWNSL